jgi:hemoglobin
MTTPTTVYEYLGGMAAFERLVEAFYVRVEQSPILRPLYPESLDEPREHMALFLAQYWGGPRTYSETRGHPRLRMRHNPFRIGTNERDAWVACMLGAIDDVGMPEPARSAMIKYFEDAATFLINDELPSDNLIR